METATQPRPCIAKLWISWKACTWTHVAVSMLWCDVRLVCSRKWCLARLQNCTWPVPRTNGSYNGTHGTPRYDRCNPGKRGVHWFGLCGWCLFASRNVGSPCSRTDSYAGEASTFGLQINGLKIKIVQVPSSTSSSTLQVADRHVEVVDAFAYMGCMTDSSGGSRGEVLRRIGMSRSRSRMNMLERRTWKPSIRLKTKLRLYWT